MIARGGPHQLLPPLPRNLVGDQLGAGLAADAARRQKNQARRGIAVGRALFGLHHRQIGIGRQAEHAREIRHHLAGLLSVGLRHVRFRPAEVERSGDALRRHFHGISLDHRNAAGKRRMLELEFEYILVAGRLARVHAAAQHGVTRGHGDAHIGRKAVGGIAAHGEPAGRVHQVREIRMDGRELNALDRRVFLPRQPAVVEKRDGDRLALGERLLEAQPHGGILLVARGGNLLVLGVQHARNVERVVQLERRRGDVVVERREPHHGLHRDELLVGRDFRVDGVLLDVDAGAPLLRRRGHRQQAGRHGRGNRDTEITKHERLVLPEFLE